MSRFADIGSTDTIRGPCRCDGKQHTEDTVDLVRELPYGSAGIVRVAGFAHGVEGVYDGNAAMLKLLELGVKGWNFTGPNGTAWPVDRVTISLLDEETVNWIAGELDKRFKSPRTLPNASAAPSPDGSRGSGCRTREKRQRQSSTTSS